MQLPGIKFKAPASAPVAPARTQTSKALERLGAEIQNTATQIQDEAIQLGLSRANVLQDTDSFTTEQMLDSQEYYSGDLIEDALGPGAKGLDGRPINTRVGKDKAYRDDIPSYIARAQLYKARMEENLEEYAQNIPNTKVRNKWLAQERERINRKTLTMQAQDITRMRDFAMREWQANVNEMIQQGNGEGALNQLATFPGDKAQLKEARQAVTKQVTVMRLNDMLISPRVDDARDVYNALKGTQAEYEARGQFRGLSSPERRRWLEQYKQKLDSADKFAKADKVVNARLGQNPMDFAKAREQIRSDLKNDPAALKEAMQIYDAETARRKREKQQTERTLYDSTEQRIAEAGENASIDMVPAVSEYFPQKSRDALIKQVQAQQEGFALQSKARTINYLSDMEVEDPAKFARIDLNTYRPDLSPSDYRRLYESQNNMQKGIQSLSIEGSSTWNRQVNEWIKSTVGRKDPISRWDADKQIEAAKYREVLMADYRRAVLEKGGPLSQQERNELLFEAQKVFSNEGWFFSSDRYRPELDTVLENRRMIQRINDQPDKYGVYIPHTQQVQALLAKRSAEVELRLKQQRERRGLPVTEGDMLVEYLMYMNRKAPIAGFDTGVR